MSEIVWADDLIDSGESGDDAGSDASSEDAFARMLAPTEDFFRYRSLELDLAAGVARWEYSFRDGPRFRSMPRGCLLGPGVGRCGARGRHGVFCAGGPGHPLG